MELHNLKRPLGDIKPSKRLGRGEGSGKGGTCGAGHKGAQSRSGYKRKAHFEGGQMPLQRRIPKRGFKPINRTVYKAINLYLLIDLAKKLGKDKLTRELLYRHGLVGKKVLYKVLAKGGEVGIKLEVEAHAFSRQAIGCIEKGGGRAIKLEGCRSLVVDRVAEVSTAGGVV